MRNSACILQTPGINVGRHTKPEITHSLVTDHLKESLDQINVSTAFNDINEQNLYKKEFLKSILNQGQNYPDPIQLLSLRQNGELLAFLTLKSFSLWQGKQKSKKTTALACAVAALIKDHNETGLFFQACIPGKVLFIDNEQGESYAARTMKLILKIAGLDSSDKLIYCDLRPYSPRERMKIIHAALQHTKGIKLVVIDGLVDLMNDFMDANEGHQCTTELLKLCSLYDIHIAGVLHQNKNDKNARAHIGTISSQKCEIEISTEVDPNNKCQSIVSCVNSRGIPFEPFSVKWEKGSLPVIVDEVSNSDQENSKTSKNYGRSKEIAEGVFGPLSALSHTEAIKSIMNASLKSESSAKRLLKDLQLWGIISKGTDGNYRLNSIKGSGFKKGSNEGSLTCSN